MEQALKLNNGYVGEHLYNEVKHQLDVLQQFIGTTTIQEIERLKEIEKKASVLEARLKEKDKAIILLKDEADKRVKMVKEAVERQMTAEKEQSLKYKDKNMRSKVIKPLLEENERIKDENNRLKVTNEDLMEQHKKTHKMLEDVLNKQDKILEIISSGGTVEDIKEIIIDETSIEDEMTKIKELLQSGKNQKQIAAEIYPKLTLASAQNKVKRRIDRMKREGKL